MYKGAHVASPFLPSTQLDLYVYNNRYHTHIYNYTYNYTY